MEDKCLSVEKDFSYLEKNLSAVRERIEKACKACGKNADDVLLLVATKYASCEEMDELVKLGVTDVGENRVNTLLEHYEGVENKKLSWHFIGSLQKNKVKYLCGKIKMLHSLDSLSLAEEIEKRYSVAGLYLDCLVEINIAEEESKGGISPSALKEFVLALSAYEHINIKGFMTMAPASSTEAEFEEYFRRAVSLGKDVWTQVMEKDGEPFFSIGMSKTLEAAIASGSSCVRIGSDIFGHK